jgi:hypothetical protein
MPEIKSAIVFTLLSFLLTPGPLFATEYYQPRDYGSDSLYSPFGNFLSYTFDPLQIRESFGTENFRENFNEVIDNLTHPGDAIDAEGGFERFINRQVFPIDANYRDESSAALPNYFLHLLGGGMVYRKDLEWFRVHNAAYPTAYAATLAMTAELLQEVLEKKTTTSDDEVADVLIFRPLGILLFHNDRFAELFMEYLDPAIWPYLQVYDISENRLNNAGINYIYRPPKLEFFNSRLFLFTGLNNLLGLSHRTNRNDSISWGFGLATQQVDFDQYLQVETEPSFGIFYDRNKSLLWSLVINDTGGSHFRFNLYPTRTKGPGQLGYFIGSHEDTSWSFGIVYAVQLGIGATF